MSNLFDELKRRNVFRMAVLYAIAAWVIMQVAEVLNELANLPDWVPGSGRSPPWPLVATYHRGWFRRVDAFIAFMGMDVRVRDSGRFRGRPKLTKKGEPELRRLLFNAAMQDRRYPLWEPYYLSLRQRGFSATAAFVALGRKLARVCFALLRNQTDFNPDVQPRACAST